MKLFGLTGNIGCGKSTVARLLAAYDKIVVFDCDRIAKEIMLQNGVRQAIAKIVGAEILEVDNSINWRKLSKIVFSQKQKLNELEQLVHPLVREFIAREAENLEKEAIGIVESAIIYEKQWEDAFDGVIVAICDNGEQLRRLKDLRQMAEGDAQVRINTQLPQWEKEQFADFVVFTYCSKVELLEQVAVLYQQLKQY